MSTIIRRFLAYEQTLQEQGKVRRTMDDNDEFFLSFPVLIQFAPRLDIAYFFHEV